MVGEVVRQKRGEKGSRGIGEVGVKAVRNIEDGK